MNTKRPPLLLCFLCLLGSFIALYPILLKKIFASASALDVSSMAAFCAAYIAVMSALLWLMSALNGDNEYNAAAASFSASAAFFTGATFELPGDPDVTVPWADETRIWVCFVVAIAIPLMLSAWYVFCLIRQSKLTPTNSVAPDISSDVQPTVVEGPPVEINLAKSDEIKAVVKTAPQMT